MAKRRPSRAKTVDHQPEAAGSEYRLGFWVFNDESSGFVVFDDEDGIRKAFLLADWNGFPGYTRFPLADLRDCEFVAEVSIGITTFSHFTSPSAMLGKLVVKDGKAFMTTVNDQGKMALASIAPFNDPQFEPGEYFYSWVLRGRPTAISNLEDLYLPESSSSWLNEWISPEYESDDEDDCPFCMKGSLVMNMHSSLVRHVT